MTDEGEHQGEYTIDAEDPFGSGMRLSCCLHMAVWGRCTRKACPAVTRVASDGGVWGVKGGGNWCLAVVGGGRPTMAIHQYESAGN